MVLLVDGASSQTKCLQLATLPQFQVPAQAAKRLAAGTVGMLMYEVLSP